MKNISKIKRWLHISFAFICLICAGLFVVFLLLISGSIHFFGGLIFILFSLVLFYIVLNVKFKVPRSAIIIPAGLLILGLVLLGYSWNKRTYLVDHITLIRVDNQYVGALEVSEDVFNQDSFFIFDVNGSDVDIIGTLHGEIEIQTPDDKYIEKIDQLNNLGLFIGSGSGRTNRMDTFSQPLKVKITRPGKYIFKVSPELSGSKIFFMHIGLKRYLKPFEFTW